jgi:hypothetical protein
MMQLPPELILLVFGYLGPEFFREYLGRLTVSKQWWHLAWTVLVRHLQFDTLRPLEDFTKHEAVLARSQPYITTVRLSIGYRQPLPADENVDETHANKMRSRKRPKKLALLSDAEVFGVASSKSIVPKATASTTTGSTAIVLQTASKAAPSQHAVKREGAENRPSEIESPVTTLATTLQGCPAMRSLKVDIKLRLGMRQWVLGKPLADLLSLRHLTSLDYDTGGYLQRLTDYTGTHRCRSISAMLPSLRRLRCRMEMMCEDFLEPPPGEAPLALEEVIVHLSTSGRTRKGKAVYLMAESCQFPDVYHFIHLRELMEKQARALLVRLANPRMVRVITHENIAGYTMPYAFDVMKEERIRLPKNSKWDAEGEVVDEGGVPQWARWFVKD